MSAGLRGIPGEGGCGAGAGGGFEELVGQGHRFPFRDPRTVSCKTTPSPSQRGLAPNLIFWEKRDCHIADRSPACGPPQGASCFWASPCQTLDEQTVLHLSISLGRSCSVSASLWPASGGGCDGCGMKGRWSLSMSVNRCWCSVRPIGPPGISRVEVFGRERRQKSRPGANSPKRSALWQVHRCTWWARFAACGMDEGTACSSLCCDWTSCQRCGSIIARLSARGSLRSMSFTSCR